MQWKCVQNSPSQVTDVLMTYPKERRSFVLSLEENHVYEIRGRLPSTGTLLGLSAEPLEDGAQSQ